MVKIGLGAACGFKAVGRVPSYLSAIFKMDDTGSLASWNYRVGVPVVYKREQRANERWEKRRNKSLSNREKCLTHNYVYMGLNPHCEDIIGLL